MSTLYEQLFALGHQCKDASKIAAQLSTNLKNDILNEMADSLLDQAYRIVAENSKDVEKARAKGLDAAIIDRLILSHARLSKMASAIREIADLPDPVGEITKTWRRPNGLEVSKKRIPIGVIGMIYESRPNVTSDAAALCFKAGNCVFLRGGSEAYHSNHAIAKALHAALDIHGVPREMITLVPMRERDAVQDMLKLSDHIDIIIPRGGEGLIKFVTENSRIPVIKHFKGVCHQFVDASADIETAVQLLVDGKTSRPGVCNALETLLVHKDIAPTFLPAASKAMNAKGVELRGCSKTRSVLSDIKKATTDDYYAEFLSLVLAVRVVENMDEAIDHIAEYGSDHTEVIVTENYSNAKEFLRRVNSSVVLVNASSRFSDGGELGLGAEIGISTTKLQAYGPMGLESLTTEKFIVTGDGQIRQ